ncbi:MAG: DUF1501 domain-containing protein [Gemmataceae bacterium]|nr:DUF1501 domain-containing protein [Gemmataceae bacterium]
MLPNQVGRRSFLRRGGLSLGSMALGNLLARDGVGLRAAGGGGTPGALGALHHTPRVKRVIWLYMAGGMSHLDTFDHKPTLVKLDGQPMPESVTKGKQIAQLQGSALKVFAPQHPFKEYGQSGQKISTVFPLLGEKCADQICLIRSLSTDAINHDPAHTFMNTGTMIAGRPAMGSWVLYGLGAETQDLPGFIVLVSTGQWHSGCLPGRVQGVELRGTGDPVLYVRNPPGVDNAGQRGVVDAAQALNRLHQTRVDDPEIATRISQYEIAFRMQASVPGLMDLRDETKETLDLYGTKGGDGTFGANCLLARRLAERGVRFIQLYHRDWDHHGAIKEHIAGTAAEVDRGASALLTDLKRRGMLEDTLVIFGSEFGRTPMAQGNGRDHHLAGFTMWLAGGGVKPGFSYGQTDEFGYSAAVDKVSVHDIHATALHLLGIDHERFTVKTQGLDLKLTGVEPARVVKEVLT